MFTALLRFHLRAGVRLALRAAAPAVGIPVVAVLLQQDPAGAAAAFAIGLVSVSAGAGGLAAFAAVAVALASWAAPRLAPGTIGWFRHLPVTRAAVRRAAVAGLVVVQLPLLAAYAFAAVVAVGRGRAVSPGRLGIAIAIVGAAAWSAWIPGRRPRTIPFRREWRSVPVPLLVGVRALGHTLVTAPLAALLPVGAGVLFRINNPDLSAGVASGSARLGCGLSVALLTGTLVDRLLTRRPPWAWARSLPVGSVRRIDADAVLLGAPSLIPLVATAWMDPLAAIAVAGCLPAIALRGASALCGNTGTKAGPSARLLAEAALLAGCIALVPWLALVALCGAPLARAGAVRADRGRKVSLWEERRHGTEGDSSSWSMK
jgi:hypothetical protein